MKTAWKRASPEARARANVNKQAKARARYRYIKNVLGAPSWKAREGQHSILAMVSLFPEHQFPVELVTRKAPGPKPK
jgi:hypothetical protein